MLLTAIFNTVIGMGPYYMESTYKWLKMALWNAPTRIILDVQLEQLRLERNKWKEEYTPEMREKMTIMSGYYLNNPPYFNDLARRVLDEKAYVPTEKAFRAMCENKYAVQVIDLVKSDPLYPVGSMVRIRANADGLGLRYRNKMVMVLEHNSAKLTSAAKNARPVYVIPVGASVPFWTEERYLKKVKKTS